MAKRELRLKALDLRVKEQMSYSQIREIIPVSKGTLSYWLKDYPLSKQRIAELNGGNQVKIERFRETMKRKFEIRMNILKQEQKLKLLPFTRRELYLAGLFLYWGEGGKTVRSQVAISNSDPAMVKFGLWWIVKILGVRVEKIRAKLKLYSDMNIKSEIEYWMKILSLPRDSFTKPYIKESKISGVAYKGQFKHGTIELVTYQVKEKEKIMASLRVMSDYFLRLSI